MSMLKVLSICAVLGALLQACQRDITKGEKPPSEHDAAVANVNLAAGYISQGRPEIAIDRLQRALKQDPKLADAHTTIAIAYDQLGSFRDAEEHYKKATQLEPDNSASANAYAVFLCKQSRWKDAEPYFKRATANLYEVAVGIPEPSAVLSAALRDAGVTFTPSDKGKYAQALLARAPGLEGLVRQPGALEVITDLTPEAVVAVQERGGETSRRRLR